MSIKNRPIKRRQKSAENLGNPRAYLSCFSTISWFSSFQSLSFTNWLAFSQSGLSRIITWTLPSIRTVSLSVVRMQGWLDGLCVCSIPIYFFLARGCGTTECRVKCAKNERIFPVSLPCQTPDAFGHSKGKHRFGRNGMLCGLFYLLLGSL